MRKTLVIVLAALLAVALAGMAQAAEKLPKFELKDTNGDKHTPSELFKDYDIIVFDYWQVACKPCNELLPHLQEIMGDYKKKKVGVVVISRDTALSVSQVAPFFKSHKYPFTVLLDTDLEVSNELGVKASPVTFVVDKDRNILFRHDGYKTGQEKEITDAIDKALKDAK
jgi:peroxiredoxin